MRERGKWTEKRQSWTENLKHHWVKGYGSNGLGCPETQADAGRCPRAPSGLHCGWRGWTARPRGRHRCRPWLKCPVRASGTGQASLECIIGRSGISRGLSVGGGCVPVLVLPPLPRLFGGLLSHGGALRRGRWRAWLWRVGSRLVQPTGENGKECWRQIGQRSVGKKEKGREKRYGIRGGGRRVMSTDVMIVSRMLS